MFDFLLPALAFGGEIAAIAIAAAGAASGIAGTAVSALAANAQNRNIRDQQKAANRAAGIQSRQLSEQAALEKRKRETALSRTIGAIRVASGEAGLAVDSGSFVALQNQALFDAALDQEILDRNRINAITNVLSGAEAGNIGLQGQRQNPVVAGVTGGLSGFDAGLRIAGGVDEAFFKPRRDGTL